MTQAKPNKQKIARMIASEFQQKCEQLSAVTDETVEAECKAILGKKGIAALRAKFLKAEGPYLAAKEAISTALGVTVDMSYEIDDSLRHLVMRRQRMNGANKAEVTSIRKEERLLQSQLELAATSQDIERIMRRAGLLDEAKKG